MEFDPQIAGLCAAAQGDAAKLYPTAALCFNLFDEGAWDLLSPERPLRRLRLVEIDRYAQVPLTASPLRIDERIASYLKGLNVPDQRLVLYMSLLTSQDETSLPPSQQKHVRQIRELYESKSDVEGLRCVQLMGPNGEDKRRIATELAAQLGLQFYRLPADLIPQPIDELDSLARLW